MSEDVVEEVFSIIFPERNSSFNKLRLNFLKDKEGEVIKNYKLEIKRAGGIVLISNLRAFQNPGGLGKIILPN